METDRKMLKKAGLPVCSAALMFICLAFVFSAEISAAAGIEWQPFEEGMDLGKDEGKKIYVNFYTNNCSYCRKMQLETFRDPSVVSFLNDFFISIRVNSEREKEIAMNFRVRGVPDNWFMMSDGEVIGRRPGYIPPDDFFQMLKQVVGEDDY